MLVTLARSRVSVYLYIIVPKGFFPQQDTGRLEGSVQASQDISFAAMSEKMTQFVDIVHEGPGGEHCRGFAGGNTASNSGRMFITLKPMNERKVSGRSGNQPAAAEAGRGSRRDAVSCNQRKI